MSETIHIRGDAYALCGKNCSDTANYGAEHKHFFATASNRPTCERCIALAGSPDLGAHVPADEEVEALARFADESWPENTHDWKEIVRDALADTGEPRDLVCRGIRAAFRLMHGVAR